MKTKKSPIVIEALSLGNTSGLGKINRILMKGLEGALAQEEVIVITRSREYTPLHPRWKKCVVKAKPMRLWLALRFPYLLFRLKPKLIFCLGFHLPPFKFGIPAWLLVCDVGPLENLPYIASKFNRRNQAAFPKMIARAQKIIAISQFTKNRVHDLTGFPQKNIETIKPIVWRPNSSQTSGEKGPQSHVPYFFSHGNLEPRKNFPNLIRAYQMASQRAPNLPNLKIAGNMAWGYPEIKKIIADLGLETRIDILGYVNEKTLLNLMKNCTLYISASLYEGWGFPLFEALELNRPAIYHRDSSHREFARDFALDVDCRDPSEIARAIEDLWLSPQKREGLTQKLQSQFRQAHPENLEHQLREIFLQGEGGLMIH